MVIKISAKKLSYDDCMCHKLQNFSWDHISTATSIWSDQLWNGDLSVWSFRDLVGGEPTPGVLPISRKISGGTTTNRCTQNCPLDQLRNGSLSLEVRNSSPAKNSFNKRSREAIMWAGFWWPVTNSAFICSLFGGIYKAVIGIWWHFVTVKTCNKCPRTDITVSPPGSN